MSDLAKFLTQWNRDYFPWPDEILVDERSAVMTRRAFERSPEYSLTSPSGVYPGKRWRCKCHQTSRWFLLEYVACAPGFCAHYSRLIYIVEES
jgi:hypothetical protein